jgi:lipopolysaccharide/colanic/teichoic acid biosynthesis glycosyltransferase
LFEKDFVSKRVILAQKRRAKSRYASMHETARKAEETLSGPAPRSRVFSGGLKRSLDIAVAGILLLLLLPFLLIVTILVWIDAPGPVFFRADRVGFKGRKLRMLKFRKMRHDVTGLPLTVGEDLRFTRLGAWLAKTKLDELPQLWQVLRGEMSLVGPRPEGEDFVRRHSADYEAILSVRPGMTGLSQLAFARESEILDELDPLEHYHQAILPQKIRLDRLYAQQRGVWLDLKILFWTATVVVLRRHVAVHRETARMGLRRRRPTLVVKPSSSTVVIEPSSSTVAVESSSAALIVEPSQSALIVEQSSTSHTLDSALQENSA